jgi:drug/metabolite transporter (DMT)-like permease
MNLRTEQIEPSPTSGIATAAAMGSIALWSFSGLCYAAGGGLLGAMPYLAMSSAIGVLTIIVLQAVRGRSIGSLFRLPRHVMLAGFFGVTVYSILLGSAVAMADQRDKAHVMLLNYLWPIWIVLLGIMLLKEKVRARRAVAGAILGFVGVAMARGWEALAHPPVDLRPHAMAAVGSVLWALYSVLLRRWQIPAEQGGSTFHFAVCAVMAAGLATWQHSWGSVPAMGLRGVLLVLFTGVGPVGLAYYWWEIGMKRGAVPLIAGMAYLIPIASAALISLFYRASWDLLLLPSAGLIATGAWMGGRASR